MNWTRPANLRAQVQKLWDRGELLASFITGKPLFPKRLVLQGPTSKELTDRFDEAREWIGEIRATGRYRLEMREFKHRVLGNNFVPQEAWIDRVEDALALIAKQGEWARFAAMVELTYKQQPCLLTWLAKRPLRALELANEWPRILDIVTWLQIHPRPGIYFRQMDITGVHSKFMESHLGVVGELLEIALPSENIDQAALGVGQFAQRYGFRDKPIRIRFRILDPKHTLLNSKCISGDIQDITLNAESFAELGLNRQVSNIFITENEINFLAFPKIKNSMIIFGAGYGFEGFGKARWLSGCRISYWGDIDTHGFAILDQLRTKFDRVESFLMDRSTLLAFESQWGIEDKPTLRDLPRLFGAESELYNDLRDNRIRKNLRLEQERIGFGWVREALSAIGDLLPD